ncbi:restriction endonuclease [Vreelandella titanicae]|uniref:restriction endonuclease n=1 Tax=Vreelandella titanicae TaxID=664683 RepID=UPI003CFCA993
MLVQILGKTPQEKGLQLEELVSSVLKERGYSNLVKRHISSGGHEIDIHGEVTVPLMGKTQTIDVICECKAHAKPINTTDWLKFLGKVYVEESNTNGQISACFISLSGVNGNVWGSYKQLKENKRDNIELISGEELEKILYEIFLSANDINHRSIIEQQTSRNIISVSLAYRDNNIYWVFGLAGDTFTVLDRNGAALEPVSEIIEILCEATPGELVDLRLEKDRLEAERSVESHIYTALSANSGKSTVDELRDELSKAFVSEGKELSPNIFESVNASILFFDFIKNEDGVVSLDIIDNPNKIAFFNRLLAVGVSPKILSSSFYEELFDSSLLDEVERIQYGLKIDRDDREMLLKTIAISPSALAVAINEVQLITHHRKTQPEAVEQLDDHDKKLFLRMICERFMQDFENPILTSYYFNHVNLEEVDFNFDVKFKTRTGIHVEHQNRKRSGIGKMSDEYGGKLIRILALNESPEPWERYKQDEG